MSDDRKISELISKSLRHELSKEESREVADHLGQAGEAKKFAEISRLIQDSVSGLHVENLASVTNEAGLTQDAKKRLNESVASAISEKLSLSQAGLISKGVYAETTDSGRGSRTGSAQADGQRQVNSRFNLIRRLGQGGLGSVWLARDETLGRTVAIKELNANALESEKSWERFQREAEITGQLEHPNVVPLYQYGVDCDSGEPFYAMRFVGKRTLADAIVEYHDRREIGETGALCLHRLLTVFLDICQAIAYAHSRGVVHRDLKPENVALDNFGQVIVLDWGLAKVLEDGELASKMTNTACSSNDILNQTMHGEVVGTPLYMSPEQASGDLDRIGERTDVYGLGAILFSILTGKAPHERSATNSGSDVDSIVKIIAESATPQPVDYDLSIPNELEMICVKSMARKQHLRFESVQKLADAVESWIAGQSGKQAAYESVRMEGRELRADLQSRVRDLERNVRFASGLPPIKALISAKTSEDVSVWRERLSIIFQGLLKANPDYSSIAYCRVDQLETVDLKNLSGSFSELVRVERHSTDLSNIRTVPKSRLATYDFDDYMSKVVIQKPDEVHTSLVCDPMCSVDAKSNDAIGLFSAVPVYDEETEEVFGFVVINANIEKMLRQQMDRRTTAEEVVVACDIFHIMMHSKNGTLAEDSVGKKVADQAEHFLPAIEHLQTETDFIDETDSDIFGARIWLNPGQLGLMYLLKRK
jgi:serine/threonine protein kinase